MVRNDMTSEIDGEVLDVVPVSGLAQQHEAAAIDVQVATAQQLGRSIAHFQRDLEDWACATQEIAEECTYVLVKGGTRIVGPSIRFAELLQQAYRHIVADTFIESTERTHIVVGAMARDLFRNTAVRARVRRRIINKRGERFGEDMIQTTVQAASSLALRNAIIRLVPKALWLPIWLKSRDVAQGVDENGERVVSRAEQVQRAMAYLQTFDVPQSMVLEHLGKQTLAEIDGDDLTLLRNKARSIRAGEVDAHDAFPPADEPEDGSSAAAASEVGDRIKGAAEAKKKAAKKKAAKKAAGKKKPVDPPKADEEAASPSSSPAASESSPAPEDGDDPDEVPSVEL